MRTGSPNGLDEAHAAEIKARIERIRRLKQEYAMRKSDHPADTSVPIVALDAAIPPETPGGMAAARRRGAASPKERQMLDAIAKAGYIPGDSVSVTMAARIVGVEEYCARARVRNLQFKELWPYAPGKPGRFCKFARPKPDPPKPAEAEPLTDRELAAVEIIIDVFAARLESAASRRRVSSYVIYRINEGNRSAEEAE